MTFKVKVCSMLYLQDFEISPALNKGNLGSKRVKLGLCNSASSHLHWSIRDSDMLLFETETKQEVCECF
jgi:hypothetical protein